MAAVAGARWKRWVFLYLPLGAFVLLEAQDAGLAAQADDLEDIAEREVFESADEAHGCVEAASAGDGCAVGSGACATVVGIET